MPRVFIYALLLLVLAFLVGQNLNLSKYFPKTYKDNRLLYKTFNNIPIDSVPILIDGKYTKNADEWDRGSFAKASIVYDSHEIINFSNEKCYRLKDLGEKQTRGIAYFPFTLCIGRVKNMNYDQVKEKLDPTIIKEETIQGEKLLIRRIDAIGGGMEILEAAGKDTLVLNAQYSGSGNPDIYEKYIKRLIR